VKLFLTKAALVMGILLVLAHPAMADEPGINSSGTSDLPLGAGGKVGITIKNGTGYVGIGTSSPQALLDVQGGGVRIGTVSGTQENAACPAESEGTLSFSQGLLYICVAQKWVKLGGESYLGCNSTHTMTDCTGAGGSVIASTFGCNVCQFSYPACPSGWTSTGWTYFSANSGSQNWDGCTNSCTTSAGWAQSAPVCTFCNRTCQDNCLCGCMTEYVYGTPTTSWCL
jgi:hypothetical protein